MSSLEILRQIVPNAFDKDGILKPFDMQVDDYLWGNLGVGDALLLTNNSYKLGVPFSNGLPLVMTLATVDKIKASHNIDISELKDLPKLIQNSPFAYHSFSQPNSIVSILDVRDNHNNFIIAAIHFDKPMNRLVVDELVSLYGKKKIENTIWRALENDYAIINSRTEGWLESAGLQLPGKSNQTQLNFISAQTKKQVVPPKSPAITQRPKINTTEGESGLDPLIEQSLYNSDEMNQELGL